MQYSSLIKLHANRLQTAPFLSLSLSLSLYVNDSACVLSSVVFAFKHYWELFAYHICRSLFTAELDTFPMMPQRSYSNK
jgi:hypothetical protein